MLREEVCVGNFEFPFVMYRPATMKESLPLVIQLHGKEDTTVYPTETENMIKAISGAGK